MGYAVFFLALYVIFDIAQKAAHKIRVQQIQAQQPPTHPSIKRSVIEAQFAAAIHDHVAECGDIKDDPYYATYSMAYYDALRDLHVTVIDDK